MALNDLFLSICVSLNIHSSHYVYLKSVVAIQIYLILFAMDMFKIAACALLCDGWGGCFRACYELWTEVEKWIDSIWFLNNKIDNTIKILGDKKKTTKIFCVNSTTFICFLFLTFICCQKWQRSSLLCISISISYFVSVKWDETSVVVMRYEINKKQILKMLWIAVPTEWAF